MTPCSTCRHATTWTIGYWFWRRERARPFGRCWHDAAAGDEMRDVRADGGACGVEAKLWEGRN